MHPCFIFNQTDWLKLNAQQPFDEMLHQERDLNEFFSTFHFTFYMLMNMPIPYRVQRHFHLINGTSLGFNDQVLHYKFAL